MDERGQSAMLDAFMFFAICLVASAAVLGYSASVLRLQEGTMRDEGLSYAEDVRTALMRTTFQGMWYLNRTGAVVRLGDTVTIERFLLDETVLVAAGLPLANFAAANGAIREVVDALVRPPYVAGVEAGMEGQLALLWIGGGTGPPPDRFTSGWTYEVPSYGAVRIAVDVWFA